MPRQKSVTTPWDIKKFALVPRDIYQGVAVIKKIF